VLRALFCHKSRRDDGVTYCETAVSVSAASVSGIATIVCFRSHSNPDRRSMTTCGSARYRWNVKSVSNALVHATRSLGHVATSPGDG
jgi:hypothetical protein